MAQFGLFLFSRFYIGDEGGREIISHNSTSHSGVVY